LCVRTYKITLEDWQEFFKARNSKEAVKKSKVNNDLAKKNMHRHKLGSGGYVGKQDKWSKEAEELAKAGNRTYLVSLTLVHNSG